ncbi:hypothetical protein SNEBB_000714 [Seison nebaliae]|nr:hypothetical protein SNEBB_000714 [Seison nebaliae]
MTDLSKNQYYAPQIPQICTALSRNVLDAESQRTKDDDRETSYYHSVDENRRELPKTRMNNSGFWGDRHYRRGTHVVLIGVIMFVLAIVLVGVFFAQWWSNEINIPFQVLSITLLVISIVLILGGLLANWIVNDYPNYYYFWGEPPSGWRPTSYLIIISFIMIGIGGLLAGNGWAFWWSLHQYQLSARRINVPLQGASIIIFIVFGITLVVCIAINLWKCRLAVDRKYRIKYMTDQMKKKRKKIRTDERRERRKQRTKFLESDNENEVNKEAFYSTYQMNNSRYFTASTHGNVATSIEPLGATMKQSSPCLETDV